MLHSWYFGDIFVESAITNVFLVDFISAGLCNSFHLLRSEVVTFRGARCGVGPMKLINRGQKTPMRVVAIDFAECESQQRSLVNMNRFIMFDNRIVLAVMIK